MSYSILTDKDGNPFDTSKGLPVELTGSNGPLTTVSLPDGSQALAMALLAYPGPLEVINQAIVTELVLADTPFTIPDTQVWSFPDKIDFTNVKAVALGVNRGSNPGTFSIYITPFDDSGRSYANSTTSLILPSTASVNGKFTTPKTDVNCKRGSINIKNNSGADKTIDSVVLWLFTL